MERILDTSILIQHWRHRLSKSNKTIQRVLESDARDWAHELAMRWGTKSIVSPVLIEFVAGTKSEHELRVTRAYLSEFAIADEGRILDEDWLVARRFAERIPRDSKPRQLGDCLIQAIAARLRRIVISRDRGFPKR